MRFQSGLVRLPKNDERQPASSGCNRSEFYFWQKNYCSGGVVAEETAKDAHTCHVQVYHDAQHASSIQLPLR